MDRRKKIAIIDAFFQYFSTTEVDKALELLDDSVTWQAMGISGGLPLSGIMDKQSIGKLMTSIRKAIPEGMKLTASGWTCEGNRVAVEMKSYGIKTNGVVYNNHYHFLVVLDGGKIQAIREYMDTLHTKHVFIDNQ
ncbi:hypothetical protein BTJ40_19420 [Microbulbifer sp. A4B17]|uniref:nuclear transport factor 2 family protein n=1 Tax=Microbulbifer sp. A4B17 TaxID=359370 RepID=UPI000D52E7F8|nr:nuclear transport factor 2 family protein [Microbulbifer sp. A4B17]AWF82810.1 hypothetical protein BTJ40_19420 [Microbulbifer sp. A4B17]